MSARHRLMVVGLIGVTSVGSAATAAAPAARPESPVHYRHGEDINLCSMRGAKATAGPNLQPNNDPAQVLHQVYGEIRWSNNYGPCWWMVELPQPMPVSRIRLAFRTVISSVGFKVKTSLTPLPEATWANTPALVTAVAPLTDQPADYHGYRWAEKTWKPLPARFIRVEFTGHNGAESGQPGVNHPDLVLHRVQLTGPNAGLVVNPLISLAQSRWAGSSVTLRDAAGDRDCREANDDMEPGNPALGNVHLTFFADGSPADPNTPQTHQPASFVIHLGHRGRVQMVAFSALKDDRRPRDVKVFTSDVSAGEDWTLQKEAHDLGGVYEEFSLDNAPLARRVRLDVTRVWNPNVDPNQHHADGRMGELYVYGTALPHDFAVNLPQKALTSGTVVDAAGQKVRSLWQLVDRPAGNFEGDWDGLDDTLKPVPAGAYTLRVMLNPGEYKNVAAIGNSGQPPNPDGHIPMNIAHLAVDRDLQIYSANGWDEAGHDWHVWDKDGKSVRNANFVIRNGDPNGLTYRVCVDDRYFYCGYFCHNGMGKPGSQWLERFDRATGKAAPWPKGTRRDGVLMALPVPETPDWPLTDLAVVGNTLLVGNSRDGQIMQYDKTSGALLGSFAFANPGPFVPDGKGRLWVVQDKSNVVVVDQQGQGQVLATPLKNQGEIGGLDFAPDGKTLYVADHKSSQLRLFKIDDTTATPLKVMGQKAQPGDAQPDHFYQLWDVAVGSDGSVVTSDHLPVGGSRLVRWKPDLTFGWEQLGLEFTGNGNYAPGEPGVVTSTLFHRYRVEPKTGQWRFDGNLYTGGNVAGGQWHGSPKWVVLGGNKFFFFGIGDGMQAYRLQGNALRFVAAIGGRSPDPTGESDKQALGQWTWTDANGDGKVDETEITWFKKPGEGRYGAFGMNVDPHGNVLFCEQGARQVIMLPMLALNPAGNPTYDWAKAKPLMEADTGPVKFAPSMAARTEDQRLYALGKSERGIYPPPAGSGPAWMAGWVLGKWDPRGKLLWMIPLPNACPALDVIPGGHGVVCGYFASANLWQVNSDGELIGMAKPGAVAGNMSGWLDNTSSVTANLNPADGLVDFFAEEDYAHRILWYRCDDSKVQHLTIPLVRP